MKRIILMASLIALAGLAQAQEFKRFQLHMGLGIASSADDNVGIVMGIEPSYRLSDRVALGLQGQWAILGKGLGDEDNVDATTVGSLTGNVKYYFGNGAIRPFIGFGLGNYALGEVEIRDNQAGDQVELGNAFGFYPRVGLEVWHFNVTADYNFVGKSKNVAGTLQDVDNDYFSLRVGIFLGGGRH